MTTPLNDDLVKYMRELANSKMDVVLSNSFYEPTEYRETVVSATLHNGANEIERLRAELTEANARINKLKAFESMVHYYRQLAMPPKPQDMETP